MEINPAIVTGNGRDRFCKQIKCNDEDIIFTSFIRNFPKKNTWILEPHIITTIYHNFETQNLHSLINK